MTVAIPSAPPSANAELLTQMRSYLTSSRKGPAAQA